MGALQWTIISKGDASPLVKHDQKAIMFLRRYIKQEFKWSAHLCYTQVQTIIESM
jgi:hypothetical protein